jgi:acyl carrier protein
MSQITHTDQGVLYQEITALLVQLFDLSPDQITPDARLYEDLELDSIDAVDMVVHLQKQTGQKVKPEVFKSVRTVQDVVQVVEQLLQDKQSSVQGQAR